MSSAPTRPGTLTKAEMTVKAMYVGGQDYEVTGAGYEPVGEFVLDDATLPKDEVIRRLEPMMRAMTFCNDSKVLAPAEDRAGAVDRRPHRGLPAGRRAEGRVRPAERADVNGPRSTSCRSKSGASSMSVVHVEGGRQPKGRSVKGCAVQAPSAAARTCVFDGETCL